MLVLQLNLYGSNLYIILISLVLGLFVAMLFVNFYFRWKVIKIYQRLVQQKVDFNAEHIFNPKKLEREVLPNHPQSAEDIKTFISYMKFSFKMAAILIVLITAFGAILMYYSKYAN